MPPQDHDRPDATVALTAAGVTVLIDAGGGRLPAIVHWGHELPALDAAQAAALVAASVPVVREARPAWLLRRPHLVSRVHHPLGLPGRRDGLGLPLFRTGGCGDPGR